MIADADTGRVHATATGRTAQGAGAETQVLRGGGRSSHDVERLHRVYREWQIVAMVCGELSQLPRTHARTQRAQSSRDLPSILIPRCPSVCS